MTDTKAGQCLGFSLVVLGCLLFAIFSSQFLPEYLHTTGFNEVTCTVQTSYHAGNSCCDPSGVEPSDVCSHPYPCYMVTVTYNDGGGTGRTAVMYKDYVTYIYQDNATCSYYECTTSYESSSYDNEASSIEGFITNKGSPGDTYTCHYDPSDNDVVFLSLRYTDALMVNLLLWSIIILIAGAIIVAVMCALDSENNCCHNKPLPDEDDAVIILHQPDKYQYDNASMAADSRPKTAISRLTPSVEPAAVPGYNYDLESGSKVGLEPLETSSRPQTAKSNLLQVPA